MVDAFSSLSHLKGEFHEQEQQRNDRDWEQNRSKPPVSIVDLPALNLNEGTNRGLRECLEDWVLLRKKLEDHGFRVSGLLSGDVSTISKAERIIQSQKWEDNPSIKLDELIPSPGELHHRMMNRWIAARHGWRGECGMKVLMLSCYLSLPFMKCITFILRISIPCILVLTEYRTMVRQKQK